MIVDIKICANCNSEFGITKHQRSKQYCSDKCSKGYYTKTNKGRTQCEDLQRKQDDILAT